MKNLYSNFLLAMMLLGCYSDFALAEALQVRNENLYFEDVVVPTTVSFNGYDEEAEVKPLFSATCKDNFVVIKVLSLNKNEYWLFNRETRRMSLVDTHPTNFKVSWLSSNMFLLQRKSMGTSISILKLVNEISQIKSSGYVPDFIAVDEASSVILSMAGEENKLRFSNFAYNEHVLIEISDDAYRALSTPNVIALLDITQCNVLLQNQQSQMELLVPLSDLECARVVQLGIL